MRILISTVLFVICILPGVNGFAVERGYALCPGMEYSHREEFRAEWESVENGRIIGEAALRSLRNGDKCGFRVNAICSSDSIREVSRTRDKLLSIIRGGRASGVATAQCELAVRILRLVASVDVTALSMEEVELVKELGSLPAAEDPVSAKSLCGSPAGTGHITLSLPGGAVFSPGSGALFHGMLKARLLHGSGTSGNITPGRNFETAHADYYRLFLYMRADTGDASCLEKRYSPPPANTRLYKLLTSFIHIHQNRLQQSSIHQKVPYRASLSYVVHPRTVVCFTEGRPLCRFHPAHHIFTYTTLCRGGYPFYSSSGRIVQPVKHEKGTLHLPYNHNRHGGLS